MFYFLQCVHWKTTELAQMEGSYIGCNFFFFLVLMNSAETLLKFTRKLMQDPVQRAVMYSLDAVRKIGASLRGIKVSLHERL